MAKRQNISKEDYLSGLNDIIGKIQSAVDNMESASVQGLADALIFIGTESQTRTPVDTGDLRGSLEITIDDTIIAKGIKTGTEVERVAQPPENGSVGRISYNTPYAANQHEHVEYDHPKGGQAKYLESVLVEYEDRILSLIGGAVINSLEEP